jgi:hypothetical protein
MAPISGMNETPEMVENGRISKNSDVVRWFSFS